MIVLVEKGVFGITIVEPVTRGSYYDRSLHKLLILEDVMEALQEKVFWKYGQERGESLKDQLRAIDESLELRNKDKVII